MYCTDVRDEELEVDVSGEVVHRTKSGFGRLRQSGLHCDPSGNLVYSADAESRADLDADVAVLAPVGAPLVLNGPVSDHRLTWRD